MKKEKAMSNEPMFTSVPDADPLTVTTKREPVEPQTLQFHLDGAKLFTVHKDGRIERGPGFTTEDEMSLEFWELIDQCYPKFLARD
jgi:hypothetical protein